MSLKNIDWNYIDNVGFITIVNFIGMCFLTSLLILFNRVFSKYIYWVLDEGIVNACLAIGKEVLLIIIPIVGLFVFAVVYYKIRSLGEE